MTTEFCVIEPGCMADIDTYIREYELNGYSVAIYDENTYKATEGFHPKADKEIILPVDNLHADNHGVALAICQIPENCAYLIAVGSGTVHDITLNATNSVINHAEEIKNGNITAYEKLTYGLLMSEFTC